MDIFSATPIPEPDCLAVGRNQSFFFHDIQQKIKELEFIIAGSRILVIGGAGSIGSNTIHTISRFKPKLLHVVDQNENGLAELVRQLRSRSGGLDGVEFRTFPINYGNTTFEFYLQKYAPFDYILNFAALKHVRSEKDVFSILEMLRTNLILMSSLLEMLKKFGSPQRFFSVSTDKAANPSSMMGASKRLMEHFLFDPSLPRPSDSITTSARFANVAYSNGSLLQSFHSRLAARQPLVAPRDCRRYFVSLDESGHICTLAALLTPENTLAIPKLDPQSHLVLLEDVLFDFLHHHGYAPEVFECEEEARASVDSSIVKNKWPVLLTHLDTSGEKPYEEFYSKEEEVLEIGLETLLGVRYLSASPQSIVKFKDTLTMMLASNDSQTSGVFDKDTFRNLIASVEPNFLTTHKESNLNLDQRM